MFKSEKGFALLMILFSFVFPAVFGGLIFGVLLNPSGEKSNLELFIDVTQIFYLWFSGFITVAGLLTLIFNITADDALKYGAGLYYGTIISGGFINNYLNVDFTISIVGAGIICALICYIVWLKNEKNRSDEDDY